MTVKDLIEALLKIPPDLEVLALGADDRYITVNAVELEGGFGDGDKVVLQ